MNRSSILGTLHRSAEDLLSALLPSPCAACHEFREPPAPHGVCLPCWDRIDYIEGPTCGRCGLPVSGRSLVPEEGEDRLCGGCGTRPPGFDRGLSMAWYQGSLRDLVRLLKFSDRPDLAAPLALRAVPYLRRKGALAGLDLIVPVPLAPLRRLKRGYNQAAELGACLARLTGLPASGGGLRRRLGSRPQAGLPAARRRSNVRGQFLLRPAQPPAGSSTGLRFWPAAWRGDGEVQGRSILLVDDVWTTGATLRECAGALRRAGARRVVAFGLARTPGRF